MASEQFSLCWDNFHKNMSSGMNSLLENEDLVDVTLAVEGRCLKAHKMVLSVCSPYFKELFKSNPCQHPIVFMKDVSYVALSDLLLFMYQGEVQVSQENLSTFIKTAEALQIKGLTGDGNGTNDTESESFNEKPHPEEYKPVQRPKKQPASQIAPSAAPHTAKRMRIYSNESQASPSSSIITKPEPPHQSSPAATVGGSGNSSIVAGASAPGASSVSDMIQFKMEPYDHSQNIISVDEAGGDDTFDENLDDANVDETEDYSMVEGNEDEPQAGTSADGAGDGQGAPYEDYGIWCSETSVKPESGQHYFKLIKSRDQRRCKGCYLRIARESGRLYAQCKTPRANYKCIPCNKTFCLSCFHATHQSVSKMNLIYYD